MGKTIKNGVYKYAVQFKGGHWGGKMNMSFNTKTEALKHVAMLLTDSNVEEVKIVNVEKLINNQK